jgi:hypothetical protein
MFSISSSWLSAISDFRPNKTYWPWLTWFYQVLFSIFVSLAEVRHVTFAVLILLLNMFHCFLAWRCQPFNSKFNSILERVLSGLNAAFTIVAVVGAADTSKTEEAGDIVFYVVLGIAIAFASTLFLYDRVRVPHIEDMSFSFQETLPHG